MIGCAALILAAGASRRLGRPKQLELLGGEPLLARAIRMAKEAGCAPVFVVLGAHAAQIEAAVDFAGCTVIHHPGWAEGMGSSLAAAAKTLPQGRGVLVLACDMPTVTASHLRQLAAAGIVTGSSYAGRVGVPAFFPASMVAALTACAGDTGARDLLRSAAALPLPGGELDIDTEQQLQMARMGAEAACRTAAEK